MWAWRGGRFRAANTATAVGAVMARFVVPLRVAVIGSLRWRRDLLNWPWEVPTCEEVRWPSVSSPFPWRPPRVAVPCRCEVPLIDDHPEACRMPDRDWPGSRPLLVGFSVVSLSLGFLP